MKDDEMTPSQWRQIIGFLPVVPRGRVKRLITNMFRQTRSVRREADKGHDRLDATRTRAVEVGNQHLPATDRLLDRVRIGMLFRGQVSTEAFCGQCHLAWPCPTYRLAHDVSNLTYGWDVVELGRATITITREDR